MADVADAPAPAATRPTKPDEALYRENLAKAEKDHAQVLSLFNAIKQKIDLASGKNSENPINKRKNELLEQKKEIIAKQGDGKNSRTSKQDEIQRLDVQIKAVEKSRKELADAPSIRKLRESQDKDSKKPVTDKELDDHLKNLQDAYARGLTLAQERENVAMTGSLIKLKKTYVDQQQEIDKLQVKVKEIKDTMNSPEAKALSEQYDKVQQELNAIAAEQAEAKKSRSSLFEEKDRLKARQDETWAAIKKIKDEYHGQLRAFKKYESEQKQKAWERSKAERERRDKERKLERAQRMLAEASDPAYLDEIRRANSLLQYYDPSFVPEKAPLQASTNLQAQAERKVDASDIKGVKVLSKKDRDEDLFPAQKKGKKGKKNNAANKPAPFSCPPSVVEDCSFMGIDPPMSADEVPAVVEKVRAKLDHWKADQAAQTQKNIEKAKKEIEKIEAEEAQEKGGKKPPSSEATPNGNGAASEEEKSDDKVEDVTKAVENASIEETKEEAAADA
ncbi:nuclear segregation protein [Diaporthe helianthi]|uniref:Nuclear segregation protein n=1 Tax=Diaporthe helianthi TaxID=158607 RepID=A0A2P5HYY5_DIAHE|nr:nuclear segregation protein [Diaporthe helianthi]